MKRNTANAGADAIISQTKRHVRTYMRQRGTKMIDGETFIVWLEAMKERAQKRKGGLGRQ